MSVFRVVFLGTPEFACHSLQTLIDDDHYDVVGVVSQPDRPAGRKMKLQPSPIKLLAEKSGIPVLTPENVNKNEVLEQIVRWQAEVAVVVAFGQLMSQKFLDLFPNQVVNVHASLLPRWRGAAPIQRAIMAGDQQTGVSLQVMVKKLDAGDVLGTRKIAIGDMDAIELHNHLARLGGELLHVELMDYLRGHLSPVPQNSSQVTYAKKIEKSEAELDWNMSAEEIYRKIRGLSMGPGVYVWWNGKKLKIHKARVVEDRGQHTVQSLGSVAYKDSESILVQTHKNFLSLIEVQPESKPRMSVAEFLRGYPIKIKDKFV